MPPPRVPPRMHARRSIYHAHPGKPQRLVFVADEDEYAALVGRAVAER